MQSGVSLISSCWDDFLSVMRSLKRKGEADPLLLHSPTKKKILLKHYYPSPPPKKLYFVCICFFLKFCMYALMIVDTTSKVDQCKAHLFLESATLLSDGLFYYKGTIKHHFEMTRFMYSNYLNLWLRFPPVMMLKPQSNSESNQLSVREGCFIFGCTRHGLLKDVSTPPAANSVFCFGMVMVPIFVFKHSTWKKQGCNL